MVVNFVCNDCLDCILLYFMLIFVRLEIFFSVGDSLGIVLLSLNFGVIVVIMFILWNVLWLFKVFRLWFMLLVMYWMKVLFLNCVLVLLWVAVVVLSLNCWIFV